MAYFLSDLITKDIDGRFHQLTESFGFYCDTLHCAVWVPQGFITDFESVPVIKSESDRGGTGHDYVCRIDAVPGVTKKTAAKIYLELQIAEDKLARRSGWKRVVWRNFKALFVRYAWGYWHKHKVNATYEEIK